MSPTSVFFVCLDSKERAEFCFALKVIVHSFQQAVGFVMWKKQPNKTVSHVLGFFVQ